VAAAEQIDPATIAAETLEATVEILEAQDIKTSRPSSKGKPWDQYTAKTHGAQIKASKMRATPPPPPPRPARSTLDLDAEEPPVAGRDPNDDLIDLTSSKLSNQVDTQYDQLFARKALVEQEALIEMETSRPPAVLTTSDPEDGAALALDALGAPIAQQPRSRTMELFGEGAVNTFMLDDIGDDDRPTTAKVEKKLRSVDDGGPFTAKVDMGSAFDELQVEFGM